MFVRVISEFVFSFLYIGLAMDRSPHQMSKRFIQEGLICEAGGGGVEAGHRRIGSELNFPELAAR
jgi:hypothetical protein